MVQGYRCDICGTTGRVHLREDVGVWEAIMRISYHHKRKAKKCPATLSNLLNGLRLSGDPR